MPVMCGKKHTNKQTKNEMNKLLINFAVFSHPNVFCVCFFVLHCQFTTLAKYSRHAWSL